MDARYGVLSEIVRLIGADAALAAALGTRITDGVPAGAAHPFAAFGEVATTPLDADADGASEHRIVLDVVSAASRTEASGLADRVRAVLEAGAPAPAGVTVVALRHVSTAVTGARDGLTWTARMRLRAVTQQTE
jgi:hypothetical protein